MKQPAINSLFPASKHYSQPAHSTQDKDYIVATAALDTAKQGTTKGGNTATVSLKVKPSAKQVQQPATKSSQESGPSQNNS